MIIRHFTESNKAKLINECGYIDLEGCNAKRGWDQLTRKERREVWGWIGRHVWLTEATDCKTAANNSVAYEFNSEDIGAVRWQDYKQRFRNSKKKWKFVEAMDTVARMAGDNCNDYWLVDTRIDITKQLVKETA